MPKACPYDFSMPEGRMNPPINPLRLFVSYASEDNQLAIALHHLLKEHLKPDFADVAIDTESLRAGFDLADQIRDQLAKTDILIVVYTGQLKASHGFTGLEVGFFLAQREASDAPVRRRIVSFYRETLPDTVAATKGVPFGIDDATLRLSAEQYEKRLQSLDGNHPVVAVLKDLERDVNVMRGLVGLAPDETFTAERRLANTREFLRAIFNELRKGIEVDQNPQRKLVISVAHKLDPNNLELPDDAELRSEGAGPIFGIPDQRTSWGEFLRIQKQKYLKSWKDVIETVVMSSLGGVEVDNSQIVVSFDRQKLYRVILSRSIKFYNERREFHLYFVEVARRNDFGNELSTRLLKALGLCCRFRFMFFEPESEFSEKVLTLRLPHEIRDEARKLVRELNLMQRDSMEAKLDSAVAWIRLIDFNELAEMHALYAPIEEKIRAAADGVLASEDSAISSARDALIRAINELQGTFAARNAKLIHDLGVRVTELPTTRAE
jgi:hypothetical protein